MRLSARLGEPVDPVFVGLVNPNTHGGGFLVIGPEEQIAAWEGCLRSVEGEGTVVYRLVPRDFWLVEETQP